MSSHFATGVVRRTPPSWCKKGMFVGVDPDLGPLPRTMNAMVHWLVTDTDIYFQYDEQVHLSILPSAPAWKGSTTRNDQTTSITIVTTATPRTFTITVVLTKATVTLRSSTFSHTQPAGVARWDTGILRDVTQPGLNETTMRLLA